MYEVGPALAPPTLLKALGIQEITNSVYNRDTNILIVEIDSADKLGALTPDYAALLKSHDSIAGVVVTAPGANGIDYHLRYFWPWTGTNEDPVTGGAQTFLAKYWGQKLGKTKMKVIQSSERVGRVEVELTSDRKVLLRGHSVVVFEGEFKCENE